MKRSYDDFNAARGILLSIAIGACLWLLLWGEWLLLRWVLS
jgi:hypothetical protein